MAQIKTTAIVADIKGKLNGSVFQGNNGVISLRQYAVPCNRSTPSQQLQRNSVSFIQNAWRNIGNDARRQWNDYANILMIGSRNNPKLFINGHMLFVRLNSFQLLMREEYREIPQGYSKQFVNLEWSLSLVNDRLLLQSNEIVNISKCVYIVEMSSPVLASQNYNNKNTRYIYIPWENQQEYDITENYISVFGALPVADSYVNFKITPIDIFSGLDGFTSISKKIVTEVILPYDSFSSNIARLYSLNKRLALYSGPAIRVRSDSFPYVEHDIPFNNENVIDWDYLDSVGGSDGWNVITIYDQSGNVNATYGGGAAIPTITSHRIAFTADAYMSLSTVNLNGSSPFCIWICSLTGYQTNQDLFGDTAVPSSFLSVDMDGNLVLDTQGGGSLLYGGYLEELNKMAMVRNQVGNVVSLESETSVLVSDVQNVGIWPIGLFGIDILGGFFYFDEVCIVNSALTADELSNVKSFFI